MGADVGKQIDDLYTSGADVGREEINARGDELAAKFAENGLEGEDLQNAVMGALRSEGYLK